MITHLFVYGTLRPGQQRWKYLAPFIVDEGHDGSAAGALYDTGHGYPAARFDRPGSIRGRIYSLDTDRLDECLRLLDEVEAVVFDLFRRVVVTTSTGLDAWAYEYCGMSQFPEIASGDWLGGSA
ncbi:MAG: gamma-glutamylcyclotransferase [Actinomycetota bacterium]|nr:gamma-glutamylcyclotransferase [Actinomycetota bacterium]